MARPIDVADCILSSFLFYGTMDFHDGSDLFELDENYFFTPFQKHLCKRINEELKAGTKNFQYFTSIVEDKVAGTSYELDFINAYGCTSISMDLAKQYHDDFLRKKYNTRLIQGLL